MLTRDKQRLQRDRLRRQKIDEKPPRCARAKCTKVIPKPRRYHRGVKYCSDGCTNKAADERRRQKKALKTAQDMNLVGNELYPENQTRRGTLLTEIRAELSAVEFEAWVSQQIADAAVADRVKATRAAVGMCRRAAWNDKLLAAAAKAFVLQPTHQRMLGPSDTEMRELLEDDPKKYERMLDSLVQAFVDWRDTFFKATSEGTYVPRQFHRDWIRATLNTIYTGGRQLILSPPRHGKTDLLIHFCVWLIIRDAHIRILWVGPNDEIAQNSLGQVRNLLETHEELRLAYLGEHHHWAPQKRSGSSTWQKTKFTVATRKHQMKMPTMWCTGVKGKILSLDADFIVVDDPADPDDSGTEGGREVIYNWFRKKLLSRKMHRTGLAMISSRVHPSDLYSNYLDSAHWDVIIDRAHNGDICGKDLFDAHIGQTDCVLFPELNPLDYLRLQADDVGAELFDMMYQNQPRPDGTMIFDPEVIRDKCLDRSRGLGLLNVPQPYRLVAGLDPAARGVQAAFLWAVRLPSFYSDYDPQDPRWRERRVEHYFMVDMETQSAGGIEGAVQIMRDWFVKYGCELWVVEDNSYQKVFFDDPRVKKLQEDLALKLRPAHSGGQTYDENFGVSSTAPLYHEGKVTLPYGTPEAVRKTNAFITQLTNFTNERAKKPGKSDILMASWFPHATIIKRWKRDSRESRVRQDQPYSFPDYVTSTTEMIPWGPTTYPGMN